MTRLPDRRRAELLRTAVAVWAPLLAVLVAVVAVTQSGSLTPRMLMQDTTTVLDAPFYVGSVSLLGVLLWSAATAICLFGALALATASAWRGFLLWSGVLSAVLTFDDAFLFHDEILPVYGGINGELFGLVYLAGTLALIVRYRAVVAASNWPLLGVALVLFSASAGVDVLSSRLSELVPSGLVTLGEDGPKLLGIGTWLAYYASVARQVVEVSTGSAPDSPRR